MSYLTRDEMAAENMVELQVIWTPEHEPAWLATLEDGSQVIIHHDEEPVPGAPVWSDRYFWLTPASTVI